MERTQIERAEMGLRHLLVLLPWGTKTPSYFSSTSGRRGE